MPPKKRKNGITVVADDGEDIEDIRKRRRLTENNVNVQKTKDTAKNKCREIITWLVNHDLTRALKTSGFGKEKEEAVKLGQTEYWFKWKKIDQLSEDVMDFLSSKKRQLPSVGDEEGEIIQESHQNLSKYRSAVYNMRQKAKIIHRVPMDMDKVELYEETLNGYFKGVQREEGRLKQEGKLSTDKGGDIFPKKMYGDVCLKCYDANETRWGLFNKLAFHTAGRTTNIGTLHVEHFVDDGDCIAVQFPRTKTNQSAKGSLLLHFFAAPHDPPSCIFLEMAIYFMLLIAGPMNGLIFPGSTTPATGFRAAFKNMFTEDYLKSEYALTWAKIVNHSWRKSALSWLSMGSGLKPSQHALDYRAGHSQDWKANTYYQYIELADYEIGRAFVAPVGTKEASALPPHFVLTNPDGTEKTAVIAKVVETVKCVFPWYNTMPLKFQSTLVKLLASAVYHSDWIKSKYPSHDVLNNHLFMEVGLLDELKNYLGDIHGDYFDRKGISFRDKVRNAMFVFMNCQSILLLAALLLWRGGGCYIFLKKNVLIPTNIFLFRFIFLPFLSNKQIAALITNQEKILENQQGLGGVGGAAPEGLATALATKVTEAISPLATLIENNTATLASIQSTLASAGVMNAPAIIGVYNHACDPPLVSRRIPEGFEFGKPNVMQAYLMWHRGNNQCGVGHMEPVGPFKDIDANDLKGDQFKKARKVWSDWKAVNNWICAELDKKITPNWSWRAAKAWSPVTVMMVANLIPDGKLLGLSKRSTQPTKNSIPTVCRLIRQLKKDQATAVAAHLAAQAAAAAANDDM